MLENPLPRWLPYALAAATWALLAVAEARRPLRVARYGRGARTARNAATFALAAVPLGLQSLALLPLLPWVARERIGLLNVLDLAGSVRVILGILLLDLTLWAWHRANHVVPFLWRFHVVHHADLDMDASTAIRFHFGEMALSAPFRALQVVLIGVEPAALALWNGATLLSILFHHSNLRLPLSLERRLVVCVVTPRMHGIHHSTVRAERNSNYASLLTLWDRLFGTLLLSVPQDSVRIGVPGLLDARQVSLARITALPFTSEASCGLGEDGVPARAGASRVRLAG